MKILLPLVYFFIGGTVALLIVNYGVIAANVGDLSTPEGMAVYNLHNHLLDYVIFFIGGTLVSILGVIIFKVIKKKS